MYTTVRLTDVPNSDNFLHQFEKLYYKTVFLCSRFLVLRQQFFDDAISGSS